jgi:quercetin dioxygenase-like cupin family protein
VVDPVSPNLDIVSSPGDTQRHPRPPAGQSPKLEQTVLELVPRHPDTRATGAAEEVLFVLSGKGRLRLGDANYELEPETGAYLRPGEEYELEAREGELMRILSVQIHDPVPAGPDTPRQVVRRLADQQPQAATTEREFRIVADPHTGLLSATQFVGYIPTVRAPEHFHTYDEVIYVLEGEGVLHVGGAERPVSAGSSIDLPARIAHCLENTGDEVMRVVAVFRPAGSPAAAYYPDGTPAHPSAPPLSDERRP